MIQNKRSELKAGLFLNLILSLAMVSILLLGGHRNPFRANLRYRFTLTNAQGLIPGAKVLIAGVQAGRVKSLGIDPDTRKVDVYLEIFRKYKGIVRADSVVDVASEGVLGDKYVLVSPGQPEAPEAADGSELVSRAGVGFDQLLAKGNVLLESANRVVVNLEKLTNQPEAQADLSQLIANLKDISGKLNAGLRGGDLQGSFEKLNRILAKIDSGSGTIGALLNDPAIYDDMKSLIGEANKNRIMRNLVRKSIEDSERERPGS
ncbi:MAG: MlaD family protein [Oligoflexia bacterium]|nr:MlaD family protein [Oligoflexia bacterium]